MSVTELFTAPDGELWNAATVLCGVVLRCVVGPLKRWRRSGVEDRDRVLEVCIEVKTLLWSYGDVLVALRQAPCSGERGRLEAQLEGIEFDLDRGGGLLEETLRPGGRAVRSAIDRAVSLELRPAGLEARWGYKDNRRHSPADGHPGTWPLTREADRLLMEVVHRGGKRRRFRVGARRGE